MITASLAVTAATVAAASHMRLDKPERVAENSLENLWQMERQLSNRHLPQYPQVRFLYLINFHHAIVSCPYLIRQTDLSHCFKHVSCTQSNAAIVFVS